MKHLLSLAALTMISLQGQVPRLADGHPDLGRSGVWLPRLLADIGLNRDIPFLPWARMKFQENKAAKENDPDSRCLPPGVPRISFQASPFEIVQSSNRITFLYEGGAHVWRQVWMDGRAHPRDPNPDWLGHSIGHWEADTLVVDSVGFNDKTWLDDAGHPHSEQLHVIERYTPSSPLTMTYQVLIDDPGAYARSWTAASILSFRPGGRLDEDICLDKTQH